MQFSGAACQMLLSLLVSDYSGWLWVFFFAHLDLALTEKKKMPLGSAGPRKEDKFAAIVPLRPPSGN